MIVNDMWFSDAPHANVLHGVQVTVKQIEALKKWLEFVDTHGYAPTAVEIGRLVNSPPSSIRRWMVGWENSGLIERGKGHRSSFITGKGRLLIVEIDTLQEMWEAYIAKRNSISEYYFKITASG